MSASLSWESFVWFVDVNRSTLDSSCCLATHKLAIMRLMSTASEQTWETYIIGPSLQTFSSLWPQQHAIASAEETAFSNAFPAFYASAPGMLKHMAIMHKSARRKTGFACSKHFPVCHRLRPWPRLTTQTSSSWITACKLGWQTPSC